MMNNRPHLHRPQLDLQRNQERIPLASALIVGSVKIASDVRLPYGCERSLLGLTLRTYGKIVANYTIWGPSTWSPNRIFSDTADVATIKLTK
jgi:hypothetical protein